MLMICVETIIRKQELMQELSQAQVIYIPLSINLFTSCSQARRSMSQTSEPVFRYEQA
jgi:hypothetical protein